MSDFPSFNDWLRQEGHVLGRRWVQVRSTSAIRARYGDDVTCFSRPRMAALEEEYRVFKREHIVVDILIEHKADFDAAPALVAAFEAGRKAR